VKADPCKKQESQVADFRFELVRDEFLFVRETGFPVDAVHF
jgi:hypothetical protein